jgi:hypothetical protein
MNGSAVWLMALSLGGSLGTAAESGEVVVDIRVYDRANVPAPVLRDALEECSSILAAAGVRARWQTGDPDAEEAHTLDFTSNANRPAGTVDERRYVAVRFARGIPDEAWPGVLGFALPGARYGAHANVFLDRVLVQAGTERQRPATMLAHVLAHEIGHVLLDSNEHTLAGLMRSVWGRDEYLFMSGHRLRFLSKQADALRSRASLRSAVVENASEVARVVSSQVALIGSND